MIGEDGHGPETCNFRECKGSNDTPCPFLADERPVVDTYMGDPIYGECKHEWRQLNPLVHNNTLPRFFCIHCKKVE
jgi:hypothetical protein